MRTRFRGDLGEIIHQIEFYPNGDIRNITLNKRVETNEDAVKYNKEYELAKRKFYDERNSSHKVYKVSKKQTFK